jgi:hypothetical protein
MESNSKLVIYFLDLIKESRPLSSKEISLRRVLIKVLQRSIRNRLKYWRTRSKIKHAIDGDQVTKYFHICASNRTRQNK